MLLLKRWCIVHKYSLLLSVIVIPIYLTWTFDHSLWNPDETRDAGIAREMYVSGSVAVPRLNQEVFLEKPPLYYWSCGAVYALFGRITAGLTRLPSVLWAIIGIFFTFLIGKRIAHERVGFLAGCILATTGLYFNISHYAGMDTALAALITGSFYFFLRGNIVLFLVLLIGSFYAKGVIAFALGGSAVALYCLYKKEFKKILWIITAGLFLSLLLIGPWLAALWYAGGMPYLKILLFDNTIARFLATNRDHFQPLWFYLGSFPLMFLPWTFIFIPGIYAIIKNWRENTDNDTFIIFWFIGMFLFLSFSQSKRDIYLLPLFPAGALVCGGWLERMISNHQQTFLERTAITLSFVMCASVALFVAGAAVYNHEHIGFISITAVIALMLISAAVYHLTHRNISGVFITTVLIFCLAFVSADLFFVDDMDMEKTFVPLCQNITQKYSNRILAGYQLNEMDRGVIPFYTERFIDHITDKPLLKEYLESHKNQDIALIVNHNKYDDLKDIIQGYLDVDYVYRKDKKRRSYMVFINGKNNMPQN